MTTPRTILLTDNLTLLRIQSFLDFLKSIFIELTHFFQTIDFFAYLHFVESFVPSFIFTLFSLTKTEFPNSTKNAALLDTTRKTPDKTFSGLSFLSFHLYHNSQPPFSRGQTGIIRKALADLRMHSSQYGKYTPKPDAQSTLLLDEYSPSNAHHRSNGGVNAVFPVRRHVQPG